MLKTSRQQMNRPVLLKEWETSNPISLESEDVEYIQLRVNERKPNSKIELIPKGKDLVIRSQNWVGAISLPSGKTIFIEPKFKLSFFRMLTFVLDIREWKLYEEEVAAAPGKDIPDKGRGTGRAAKGLQIYRKRREERCSGDCKTPRIHPCISGNQL